MDDLVNIAGDSTASMQSFEAGFQPQLVSASHAVDGIIADTGNFIVILNRVYFNNIILKVKDGSVVFDTTVTVTRPSEQVF